MIGGDEGEEADEIDKGMHVAINHPDRAGRRLTDAPAQPSASASDSGEIVVTAQRRPERLVNVTKIADHVVGGKRIGVAMSCVFGLLGTIAGIFFPLGLKPMRDAVARAA